jgi:hypothetical protein
MSKQDYLVWRNSAPVIAQNSDTTVELTNGRMVRIRHRPIEGKGWVATHEDITERHRSAPNAPSQRPGSAFVVP